MLGGLLAFSAQSKPLPAFAQASNEWTTKGYSVSRFLENVCATVWEQPKTEIHIHHTWIPSHKHYNGEKSIVAMRNFHLSQGYIDIAQHVTIAPDGEVWDGRPWNIAPASAKPRDGKIFNHAGVFMIEVLGDFDLGNDRLEGAQLEATLQSVGFLQEFFYQVDITTNPHVGKTKQTVSRSYQRQQPGIRFHNEMDPKSCPGTSISKSILDAALKRERKLVSGSVKKLFVEANKARFLGGHREGQRLDADKLRVRKTEQFGPEYHNPNFESRYLDELKKLQ